MAAADVVDSQLRNTVRSARARSLRCVKAILTKRALPMDSSETSHSSYTLAFANSAPDEGQSLDKEFQRCIRSLLEPDRPSFLLFRADLNENIDGGRWLLLAWLPDVVPEVDRVRYVRSRGLLVDLVPQPYFLCELLLRQTSQLVWSTAAAALRPRPIDSDRPESTVDGAYPRSTVTMEGPVRISQAAQGLLRRLASREECCLRLVFSGRLSLKRLVTMPTIAEQSATPSMLSAPVIEAKVIECRSPAQLAKTELPATSCYFALYTQDDLVFVHWCPDRMSRDPFTRMRDDSRYAVLKSSVLSLVMEAFDPQVRVLQVDAREPQELADHANRADERAAQARKTLLVPQGVGKFPDSSGDAKFPDKGAKADFPIDWPSEVTSTTNGAMLANLSFFVRPVPHWRGGAKAHTINPNANKVASMRSKLARKSVMGNL